MLCFSFASSGNILLKVYFFTLLSSLLCRCIFKCFLISEIWVLSRTILYKHVITHNFEIPPQVFVVSPSCLTGMLFPSRYLAVAPPGLRHCPFVGDEPTAPPPPAAAPPSPPPPPKPTPTVLRRGRNVPRCSPPAASRTAHWLAQSVHPVTGRLCVASPVFYVVGFIARSVTSEPTLPSDRWQKSESRPTRRTRKLKSFIMPPRLQPDTNHREDSTHPPANHRLRRIKSSRNTNSMPPTATPPRPAQPRGTLLPRQQPPCPHLLAKTCLRQATPPALPPGGSRESWPSTLKQRKSLSNELCVRAFVRGVSHDFMLLLFLAWLSICDPKPHQCEHLFLLSIYTEKQLQFGQRENFYWYQTKFFLRSQLKDV